MLAGHDFLPVPKEAPPPFILMSAIGVATVRRSEANLKVEHMLRDRDDHELNCDSFGVSIAGDGLLR